MRGNEKPSPPQERKKTESHPGQRGEGKKGKTCFRASGIRKKGGDELPSSEGKKTWRHMSRQKDSSRRIAQTDRPPHLQKKKKNCTRASPRGKKKVEDIPSSDEKGRKKRPGPLSGKEKKTIGGKERQSLSWEKSPWKAGFHGEKKNPMPVKNEKENTLSRKERARLEGGKRGSRLVDN